MDLFLVPDEGAGEREPLAADATHVRLLSPVLHLVRSERQLGLEHLLAVVALEPGHVVLVHVVAELHGVPEALLALLALVALVGGVVAVDVLVEALPVGKGHGAEGAGVGRPV